MNFHEDKKLFRSTREPRNAYVMRNKLFPSSFSILETPAAFKDLKSGSPGVALKLPLFSSFFPCSSPILRPLTRLKKRFFSSNQAQFPPGRSLGIGRAVISRCALSSEKKTDILLDNFSSLHEILTKYGNICPEITRGLWRVSALLPGDFFEMLTRLESGAHSSSVVKFLWILFRWAPKQIGNFHHFSRSQERMISMLIQSQMLAEAESLILWSSDPNGIFSNPSEIFSLIIQGYAENFLFRNAISLYNRARNGGFKLSCSCYRALLNQLVDMENSELALKVYLDMTESEKGFCADDRFLNFIVESLGKIGRIVEALNILRQARTAGVKASPAAIDAVIQAFCSKKDFEDILNFIKEWEHVPSTFVGNKVVSSICKMFGSDYARFFIEELKSIGFNFDDVTFGVLIVQCCTVGKLRDAFIYLSESYSRGIKLNAHTYNALISAGFKGGMCNVATEIFHEMLDRDILLDPSTYKILLAGYCKYRKFDEIKKFFDGGVDSCFISLAPGEDPISKAFRVLGLDCVGVKVKRDNDVRFPKAEFFDCLGNGLYVETNNYEYDCVLEKILVAAMNPDLDSSLSNECKLGNLDRALMVKNEVIQWGLELFPDTCSQFLKLMCSSSSHVKEAISFLDEKPDLWDQLDSDILNLVVQSLSTNGLVVHAKSVLDRLLKRGLMIDNATHNALILGFYNERKFQGVKDYVELLGGISYSPCSKDIEILVSCLCKSGMVEKMLLVFDSMTARYHDLVPTFFSVILREFSSTKLSSMGNVFLEEVFRRTHDLDIEFLVNCIETTCRESYQFLLHFLVSSGRTEETLFLKQHVLSRRAGQANFVYSILLNEFCARRKLKEAAFHLQEMLANGMLPDDKNLNAIVQEFCRQNHTKTALEILGKMLRSHVHLSISGYRSLVRQLCACGLLNGALNLQKLIQGKNASSSLIFQNILIFSLFQTKNSLLVDALLENIQESHSLGDSATYNILVYGYHKCGLVSKSVDLFYDMIYLGMRPNIRSLRTIICHLCRRGELQKAIELSNAMVSHGWKHDSRIQNSLAMSLISRTHLPEAIFLLHRLEERDLISEHVCYDPLIKELCVQGEVKNAVHLLNLMLKKGSVPSQSSYISVIHVFCIHKSFDKALDFHEEMLQKGFEPSKDSSYTLTRGLIECGRIDESRNILGSMIRFGVVPAGSMYNDIIRWYYAENNMEKASEVLMEMQRVGHVPNFDTHWSLIRNLSSTTGKEDHRKGFLSSLLSDDRLSVQKRKGGAGSAV
ncbi:Pentatricopeptide repeat-containing protein [Platanthera guangdongensis]|uniref:Pentatricopeptide repeat-containing protein n=1 Tax=Platanthera guangdongensis TaxID=2320717 RepID=A0ABR2N326_9ASPA